jgi:hypothetical protein
MSEPVFDESNATPKIPAQAAPPSPDGQGIPASEEEDWLASTESTDVVEGAEQLDQHKRAKGGKEATKPNKKPVGAPNVGGDLRNLTKTVEEVAGKLAQLKESVDRATTEEEGLGAYFTLAYITFYLICFVLIVVGTLFFGGWSEFGNTRGNIANVEKQVGRIENRLSTGELAKGIDKSNVSVQNLQQKAAETGTTIAKLQTELENGIAKSQTLASNIETTTNEMTRKVADIQKKMEDLQAAIDKAGKKGSDTIVMPKDWDKDLREQLQAIAGEKKRLENMESSLAKLKLDLNDINQALKKPVSQGTPKDLAERLAKLQNLPEAIGASVDVKVKGMTDNLATFSKELKQMQSDLEKLKSMTIQREGQDIFVVALHSPALSVNTHLGAYKDLFRGLQREKETPIRVGFIYCQTAEVNVVIKLEEETKLPGNVGPPDPNATESPSRFGVTLSNAFDAKRKNRRAVLVASYDCPALRFDEPGWQEITQVDVILVQRGNWPINPENLLRWHEFCRKKRGFVHLIPRDEDDRQAEQLKIVLLQASQIRK